MQHFVNRCGACRDYISTPARLEANVRLRERIMRQRAWLATTDLDRATARRKMARGDAAHEAWLAEKYSRNPLA